MRLFISWSGEQSRAVAVALRSWLPLVLDDKVKPFMSAEDIERGSRGLDRIAMELEGAGFGIVVVSSTNQLSSWMNFEAGALGKSVASGFVAPLLVGMTDTDVVGPMKQFQNTEASDKEAVLALVQSINRALPSDQLSTGTVRVLFEAHWPDLQEAVTGALRLEPVVSSSVREPSDLLDEVLSTVRSLQRDVAALGTTVFDGRGVSALFPDDFVAELRTTLRRLEVGARIVEGRLGTDASVVTLLLSESATPPSTNLLGNLKILAKRYRREVHVVAFGGATITVTGNPSNRSEKEQQELHELRLEEMRLEAEIDRAYEADQEAGEV